MTLKPIHDAHIFQTALYANQEANALEYFPASDWIAQLFKEHFRRFSQECFDALAPEDQITLPPRDF